MSFLFCIEVADTRMSVPGLAALFPWSAGTSGIHIYVHVLFSCSDEIH